MTEKEAFALVYDKLKEIPLFTGCFNAKNGNLNFMYGIITVMEVIADKADKIDELDDMFIKNLEKSLKEA